MSQDLSNPSSAAADDTARSLMVNFLAAHWNGGYEYCEVFHPNATADLRKYERYRSEYNYYLKQTKLIESKQFCGFTAEQCDHLRTKFANYRVDMAEAVIMLMFVWSFTRSDKQNEFQELVKRVLVVLEQNPGKTVFKDEKKSMQFADTTVKLLSGFLRDRHSWYEPVCANVQEKIIWRQIESALKVSSRKIEHKYIPSPDINDFMRLVLEGGMESAIFACDEDHLDNGKICANKPDDVLNV